MRHFCTLFDSNYLSRGLTLYRSLVETGEEFTLHVFCFDDRTLAILREMQLPGVVTVSLEEFESEELKRVKPSRSKAEYCWTCTPHVMRYALDRFRLPEVTYLDADLYFYAPPSVLLAEFEEAGGSVLITEHRYSRRYEGLLAAGTYCVQFLSVKGDAEGLRVLHWWQERCTEWCYARFEDGKFGDQKYLDDWPQRFRGVHVLRNPGGGVAPWNVQRYGVARRGERLFITEGGREDQIVFFHFHHLRFFDNGFLDLGHYPLSAEVKKLLYRPYIGKLEESRRDILRVQAGFDPHGPAHPPKGLLKSLGRLQRRLKGNYFPAKNYGAYSG